jgi:hypothetical protein
MSRAQWPGSTSAGGNTVFIMLIAVAVFLGGSGKCSIDRRLPKEL